MLFKIRLSGSFLDNLNFICYNSTRLFEKLHGIRECVLFSEDRNERSSGNDLQQMYLRNYRAVLQ